MIFVLLFIVVPISELYFLVYLSSKIGFIYTLGIVVFTGILGVKLVKSQGRAVMGQIQSELADGRLPANHILEGMLILAAGLLLITPGIFTDLTGFMLLIPVFRNGAVFMLKKHFGKKFHVINYDSFNQNVDPFYGNGNNDFIDSDRIVEGDWEEENKKR